MAPNDSNLKYRFADSVRVKKSGMRGEVSGYDPETQWYVVELESGPPWRGMYEESELEPA